MSAFLNLSWLMRLTHRRSFWSVNLYSFWFLAWSGGILWAQYRFFLIKHISCQLNAQPCSTELLATLQPVFNQPLITTSLQDIQLVIQASHPQLVLSQVSKELPNRLNLTLSEQLPVIFLTTHDQTQFWGLTPQAQLTPLTADQKKQWNVQSSQIPVITMSSSMSAQLSQTRDPLLSEQHKQALLLLPASLNRLASAQLPLTEVSMEADGSLSALLPPYTVLFETSMIELIPTHLPSIIKYIRDHNVPITSIDLRFTLPVLKGELYQPPVVLTASSSTTASSSANSQLDR